MKLFRYISAAFVAAIAAVAFTACDSKNEPDYEPSGPTASGQRVFFSSPTVTLNVADDVNSAVVKVYRPQDDAASALTVQILSTDRSGLFQVPASVEFVPGQIAADIVITFVNSALVPNQNYMVELAVNEANANQYAIASTTAVICHSVWTDWAPFGYDEALGRDGRGYYVYSLLFNEPETVSPVLVMSRFNPLDPNQMQFEARVPVDPDDESKGWEAFLTFSSADGGKTLSVPSQESMEGPDGMIYVEDMFSYTGSPAYKGLSTFDPVAGLFKFNVVYYDELGVWNYGNELLQLNGYTDTNVYTLEVSDRGALKIDGKDYQVINFAFNENVSFVNYTVVAGRIDDAQVAEVAAALSDPDDSTYEYQTVQKSGNVSLTFARSGEFTVVAVGFSRKADGSVEPKATSSAAFTFETFDPDLGWETVTTDGSMTEDLINALFDAGLPATTTAVRVDRSTEFEGLYRINSPYAAYAYLDALAEAGIGLSDDFAAIIINASDVDRIYVEPSFTGLTYGSSPIWIESTAALYLAHDIVPAAEYFGTRTAGGFEFKALGMASADDDSSFLVSLNGTDFGYVADMSLELDMSSAASASVTSASAPLKSLAEAIRPAGAAGGVHAPGRVSFKVAAAHASGSRFAVRTMPRFVY